jgi:hypothetical protein
MKRTGARSPWTRRANRPEPKGETMANENQSGSQTLQLILAWGFVGIPLAWGVYQTLLNAMKLFQ